nr:MAG TPA: hypothetical protein [Caudoviricetes sp.]
MLLKRLILVKAIQLKYFLSYHFIATTILIIMKRWYLLLNILNLIKMY